MKRIKNPRNSPIANRTPVPQRFTPQAQSTVIENFPQRIPQNSLVKALAGGTLGKSWTNHE